MLTCLAMMENNLIDFLQARSLNNNPLYPRKELFLDLRIREVHKRTYSNINGLHLKRKTVTLCQFAKPSSQGIRARAPTKEIEDMQRLAVKRCATISTKSVLPCSVCRRPPLGASNEVVIDVKAVTANVLELARRNGAALSLIEAKAYGLARLGRRVAAEGLCVLALSSALLTLATSKSFGRWLPGRSGRSFPHGRLALGIQGKWR